VISDIFPPIVEPNQVVGVPWHRIKTDWGVMPSSEYYHRQADTLLTLALTATDPELSARYRNLAVEYKMLAANAGEDTVPSRSVTDNLSSAADASEAD
jgi:hypothetical protein